MNIPAIGQSLKSYFNKINQFHALSHAEEYEFALRRLEQNDEKAEEHLVLSNLRFVVKVAFEYRLYGMDLPDLIQEGNIGLIRAVRKFDPRRGVRLISYAVWWIRAHIQNYIMSNWSLVKIGTNQRERKLFYKIGKIRDASRGLNAADSARGLETLARELKVTEKAIKEFEQRMAAKDNSLDSLKNRDSDTDFVSHLVYDSPNQEDHLSETEEIGILKHRVKQAMNTLSSKEQYVIENRILAEHRHTLREIGDRMNLSKERVRQIEAEALKNLREELLQVAA